jgi:hypothetical protein
MKRGGKREGSGRKKQGITKKVSLTLPYEIWEEIEQHENVASFIKSLIKKRDEDNAMKEVTKINNPDIPISRNQIDILWNSYLRDDENNHEDEVLKKSYDDLIKSISNGIKIGERYQCPFTGKWFASMEKLVKSAIPYLIDSYSFEMQRKKEKEARKKENKYNL